MIARCLPVRSPSLTTAANIDRQAYTLVELIIFVLYPGVCNTCFSALFCRDLSPDIAVLGVDYSIDCSSDTYRSFFFVALLIIVPGPSPQPESSTLVEGPGRRAREGISLWRSQPRTRGRGGRRRCSSPSACRASSSGCSGSTARSSTPGTSRRPASSRRSWATTRRAATTGRSSR